VLVAVRVRVLNNIDSTVEKVDRVVAIGGDELLDGEVVDRLIEILVEFMAAANVVLSDTLLPLILLRLCQGILPAALGRQLRHEPPNLIVSH
jgi:hypothetical protein